jgi:hypothetical protein
VLRIDLLEAGFTSLLDIVVRHSTLSYGSAHVCGRTLPKSSYIDAVASGGTGNADIVIKRRRRAYKGTKIPLGKTLLRVRLFPMWAAWGISGAAKPLR